MKLSCMAALLIITCTFSVALEKNVDRTPGHKIYRVGCSYTNWENRKNSVHTPEPSFNTAYEKDIPFLFIPAHLSYFEAAARYSDCPKQSE